MLNALIYTSAVLAGTMESSARLASITAPGLLHPLPFSAKHASTGPIDASTIKKEVGNVPPSRLMMYATSRKEKPQLHACSLGRFLGPGSCCPEQSSLGRSASLAHALQIIWNLEALGRMLADLLTEARHLLSSIWL